VAPTTSLTEWSPSPPLALTPAQRRALEKIFQARITSADATGDFIVTPGGVVGSVDVDGDHVVVRPKMGIDRVLFMVAYAADPYDWRGAWSSLGTTNDLVDGLAALFARAARQAVTRGLLRSYRRVDCDEAVIRGRIRWNQQARRPAPVPIAVRYDVYDDDIAENQVLRAALAVLRRSRVQQTGTANAIARLWQEFRHVSELWDPLTAVDRIQWTRHNAHYRPALELARVVLVGRMADIAGGPVAVAGFTLRLDDVFERFVRSAIRHTAGLSDAIMPNSWAGRGLWLDEAHRIPLEPDVGARQADRWLFVGDVKYKRDTGKGGSHDLYQMLAYATATQLPSAFLVYAQGPSGSAVHQVVGGGPYVHVHHLALDRPPDDVIAQLRRITRKHAPERRSGPAPALRDPEGSEPSRRVRIR
jgi:5-methylcytosine-specific restriction enzyme subunit McrC